MFLTHSHELTHCFSGSRPKAVYPEDKNYIADKDNTNLCTYFKGVINKIQFELDLMSEDSQILASSKCSFTFLW